MMSFVLGDPSYNANSFWAPMNNTALLLNTVSVTNWTSVQGCWPTLTETHYVDNIESLSLLGPISAFGPLGAMGPVGSNVWNPSSWISGSNLLMSWEDWAAMALYGPLTAEGPLGEHGPFTEEAYYSGEVFLENDFNPHLRAFGVWSILGPIGPLGAVGVLGALGPIGAHGYKANSKGQYTDKHGKVVTNYVVPLDSTTMRVFDLYENFDASFAQTHVLDTSFMVEGNLLGSINGIDSYSFLSAYDQIVSVLVVPVVADESFGVTLSENGEIFASSTMTTYVNFIVFSAAKTHTFTVNVFANSPLAHSYRLFVTGSYEYLNQNNVKGRFISTH